jgi:hypothetical protein
MIFKRTGREGFLKNFLKEIMVSQIKKGYIDMLIG